MDINKEAIKIHKNMRGKIEINNKIELKSEDDLSLVYSPGVAAPCMEIYNDKNKVYDYTIKSNTVLVISDGSAVLGLGNIKAKAALPVMEGKAMLFKKFAGINAFPICLDTQDTEEIINTIKNIAPVAGGINLEDFSAPRCFEIEKRLKEILDIPVIHDDQHGTAMVCVAGLLNALKVVKKDKNVKILINGLGAAGIAITKLLIKFNFTNFCLCDINGVVFDGKLGLKDIDGLVDFIYSRKNSANLENLNNGIKDCDVFIGVSAGNILSVEMVKSMNEKPIVFAIANPTPEISFEDAQKANVAVYATGRSDYPNQINNALVFPGLFKGALAAKATNISDEMKKAVVNSLVSLINDNELSYDYIIPKLLDKRVVETIANNVKRVGLTQNK